MHTNICIFEALSSDGTCWPAQYKYLACCVLHNTENSFNRRCAAPYVNACIFLNCQPPLALMDCIKRRCWVTGPQGRRHLKSLNLKLRDLSQLCKKKNGHQELHQSSKVICHFCFVLTNMQASIPWNREKQPAFRDALAGRVRGSLLAASWPLSFEIKNHSGEAVTATPGCVWEVCDLTSMRKRLEPRDRKNKQLSPRQESTSSITSGQARWVTAAGVLPVARASASCL